MHIKTRPNGTAEEIRLANETSLVGHIGDDELRVGDEWLSPAEVRTLIAHLQAWLDTGSLALPPKPEAP